MKPSRRIAGWVVGLGLLLTPGAALPAAAQEPSDPDRGRDAGPLAFEIDSPRLSLAGHEIEVVVTPVGRLPAGAVEVEIVDEAGATVGRAMLRENGPTALAMTGADGSFRVAVPGVGTAGAFTLRAIPGWWTILPPLLAIGLALALRQVVPALIAGIWIGAAIVHGGPFTGLLRTADVYVVGALANPDHVSIVVFSLMLGGMVGIISRSGGTLGLVEVLSPWATTPRRGQLVTWFLGLVVFFDDYANTLLVGNTMRPVTDRLRISREKLAYIVDSTAAPVASIALVSTWIGYEVSLIGDALEQIGSDREAYTVFLQSLPYNFYPLLALVFGFLIAFSRRDFGPMMRAERRAAGGKVLDDGAVPLADFGSNELMPPEGKPRRWLNAAVPVLSVLAVTFLGLWWMGRSELRAAGDPLGTLPLWKLGFEGLGIVLGEADSYRALLWASSTGCLVAIVLAVGQRILTVGEGLTAWVNGMKSMTIAFVILTLAWGIGDVCADLDTSGFMVAGLSGFLDFRWLPAVVFVLSAFTAFATGTSWTTMAILIPLAVPTTFGVAEAAGIAPEVAYPVLLATISSVLAGALFGDHCSPISDTTVMSSMASGCDHVDHVRTQLPYALTVAGMALLTGYLPIGFGFPVVGCLVAGSLTLFAVVRFLGRPIDV